MQKILPIIVTTWEAMVGAASEQCPVIYVDEGFYRSRTAEIRAEMARHSYVLSWKKGKQGVFFLLTTGENRFDHARQEIYDPLGIL